MSKLIVISAPSGTGKTTLCDRLLKDTPELLLSVSMTTRAPRGAEKNGVHYFFVDHAEFKRRIADDGFAEWAEVHGNFYGTTREFVAKAFDEGKSLLLDIDVQGAAQLKTHYPVETVRIFLEPPSMAELERRLRARGTDSEETIAKRLKAAEKEMSEKTRFDHVVVNDSLDHAYLQLSGIVLHAIRGVKVATK